MVNVNKPIESNRSMFIDLGLKLLLIKEILDSGIKRSFRWRDYLLEA
jgi:hypothetical protein